MPKFFTRTELSAVPAAAPGPAASTTPTQVREATRWFSLKDGGRGKQFTASLKTNARWTKQFLHGGK